MGYVYGVSHLNNAIAYIQNNRVKHFLVASPQLVTIITSFMLSLENTFQIG